LKAEWRSLTNEEAVLDIKNAKDTADKKAEIAKKSADAARKNAEDRKNADEKLRQDRLNRITADIEDEKKREEKTLLLNNIAKKKEIDESKASSQEKYNSKKFWDDKYYDDLGKIQDKYRKLDKVREAKLKADEAANAEFKAGLLEEQFTVESEYNEKGLLTNQYVSEGEIKLFKNKLDTEQNFEVVALKNSTEFAKMNQREREIAIHKISNDYQSKREALDKQIKDEVEKAKIEDLQEEKLHYEQELALYEESFDFKISKLDEYIKKEKEEELGNIDFKEDIEQQKEKIDDKYKKYRIDEIEKLKQQGKASDEEILNFKIKMLETEKNMEIVNAGENQDEILKIKQKYAKLEEDLMTETAKKIKEKTMATISAGLSAVNGLVGEAAALNQQQEATTLANTKLTGKALDKLKHDQFKKDQAYAKAQVIMNTAIGITTAMTQDPPLDFILAGVAVATGAAQLATIANTNYVSDTSSTPSAPTSASSGSSTTSMSTPQFFTLGTKNQQAPIQKVVVVETDITKTQQNVASIQAKATQSLKP